MHSMEELLKQPEFIRSDRLSAGILNQLFAQAPEVSLLLTPNANAGEFLQAVGRGSHPYSQGPTQVRLIANDSLVDRHRLHQLLKALQFIAATGSPATAPFLKFALECVERFSGESVVQDQQPNRRQKKQQGRTAGSVERTRFYSPASRPGMRT
jgi:hypothetical protein